MKLQSNGHIMWLNQLLQDYFMTQRQVLHIIMQIMLCLIGQKILCSQKLFKSTLTSFTGGSVSLVSNVLFGIIL
jgi:hypothetical protein